jgi:hypothetical protein
VRYVQQALDASLIETQKLTYLLQEAGEPLRLNFTKALYGPYADNLRHVLQAVEGHYLIGYGDGSKPVQAAEPIRVLPGAEEQASKILESHPETIERVERVAQLIEGFESSYGLELLASVHWVATREDAGAANDPHLAADLVRQWTPRKGRMFTSEHVVVAWRALRDQGWLAAA